MKQKENWLKWFISSLNILFIFLVNKNRIYEKYGIAVIYS